ncbi:MAG: PPE family protein, nonfunctional [Candidatus Gottesmanbacteria bacterium GW2011_GWA1_43_11]|uniref:PPE family protein, nonfunctional n=1 Tax=Candidatus Gottesmanbacteria bacterium GW2011_GWA1_43_11 TaxID=1618436 RepID=A0A0G1CEN0_9BACT|nr:MAG: PPE family protein, nonfunctional [Candidatus Gottesmanbacteria bacterium GW2011_GWA1_43_11]
MQKLIFKTVTILTIIALTLAPFKTVALAQIPPAPPQAPSAPSAPSAPTPPAPPAPPQPPSAPSAPEAPTAPPAAPEAPTAPSAPTATNTDTTPVNQDTNPTSQDGQSTNAEHHGNTGGETNTGTSTESTSNSDATVAETNTQGQTSGAQDSSHGDGDPIITTGDANSSAILTNSANTNLSGSGSGSSGDINVGNQGNGSGSTNSGTVNTDNSSDTVQINDAQVSNDLNLQSVSGDNESSYNVGSSSITTGDANTTATVINGVNTNTDGVSVIEFNIDDTHTGDIVLAFPETSGCTATVCGTNGTISAQNTGNGSDSTNTTGVTVDGSDNTFQQNTADVTNDLLLVADSGTNETSHNTGGDNSITTGDANVVATVGNFVNNNISGAGEVLIAVVNIFGDLIGDILLPESSLAQSGGTTVVNSGNGSDSTNTGNVTIDNSQNTTQTNLATIQNNLDVIANTGDNEAIKNTAGFANGDNVIDSGDASVDVNVVNIANSNVLGDDVWWLVFVNDASGNWVGRILGSPDGATMAGSAGTEFIMSPDGTILAQNTGNGSGSTNTTDVNVDNSSTTTQQNTANVTNNLSLVANTGNNQASYNTGGSNSITTGNANVMANIMNFVNNNFAGGKVMISIVNVFGSWLGDFVTPGHEAEIAQNTGGTGVNTGESHSSSNDNNDSNSDANNSSENDSQGSVIAMAAGTVATTGNAYANVNTGSGTTTNLVAGAIYEDNTITVPENPAMVASTTTLPAWFWRLFAAVVGLAIIKKGIQTLKARNTAHAL